MADTLTREAIAYGSQPLSPVPQYWDGASYAKVQGINGATRIINYNSAGETFTGASPGSVQLTATSTVVISGTTTVAFSATGTVEILSSAGGTAYFSGTKPAYMTKSILNRQLIFSGTQTFSSGATATSNLSFSITGSITATFTTPNHEVAITNDGPYDLTATIFKIISAAGTFDIDMGVSFLVPAIKTSAGITVSGKTTQIQGLFNFNQGLIINITSTAAFTATVTNNVLIKELDL